MKIFRIISLGGNTRFVLSPLLMTFVIGMICMTAIAQNCNSELKAYKDRNARSANENDPTNFQLELTNNSSKSISYEIAAVRFEGECKMDNFRNASSDSNIALDISFVQRGSRNSTIVVPARSTKNLQALVQVPRNTPINRWSCIEVQANSSDCNVGAVSTVIKVFISDPTQE